MSELARPDSPDLDSASPGRAELERREDEREERRRLVRQVVLAVLLAVLLAVRIAVVGS